MSIRGVEPDLSSLESTWGKGHHITPTLSLVLAEAASLVPPGPARDLAAGRCLEPLDVMPLGTRMLPLHHQQRGECGGQALCIPPSTVTHTVKIQQTREGLGKWTRLALQQESTWSCTRVQVPRTVILQARNLYVCSHP